jgi:hypothetical protein
MRGIKMNLCQFKKFLLKRYGISRRKGNGILTAAYSAITEDNILNYDQKTLEGFVQLLRSCKFESHARKLMSLLDRKTVLMDDLTIRFVREHYKGPAAGCSTLSLGEKIIAFGPGWCISTSIRKFVVPGYNYTVGQKLERIPEGAIPVELFIANEAMKT